eukprot:scaffold6638_cov374-Prasinococcus_capsulatus_cf.AAC.1
MLRARPRPAIKETAAPPGSVLPQTLVLRLACARPPPTRPAVAALSAPPAPAAAASILMITIAAHTPHCCPSRGRRHGPKQSDAHPLGGGLGAGEAAPCLDEALIHTASFRATADADVTLPEYSALLRAGRGALIWLRVLRSTGVLLAIPPS